MNINFNKKSKVSELPAEGVRAPNKKQQIGFISAIVMVVGSCIGSGIYIKNASIYSYAQGSIAWAIVSWVVAAIGVLTLGLALLEIASVNTNSNSGVLGWANKFTTKFVSNSTRSFMLYLFLPIDHVAMAYYGLLYIQMAFNWSVPWWGLMLLSLAIGLWFMFVSGISLRAGNLQNWISTIVKFFPLVIVFIVGFMSVNPTTASSGHVDWDVANHSETPFENISPALGMFASIPAIYFAFDGFYTASSIVTEMKEPKKAPMAIIVGISAITFIYVLISLSVLFSSSDGNFNKISKIQNNQALKASIDVLVAIGIFGILNAYSLMAPRVYEDAIANDQMPLMSRYKGKLNSHRPVVGTFTYFAIYIPFFVLFSLIGALAYFDLGHYGGQGGFTFIGNDSHVAGLYSIIDLISNWTSVFIFGAIVVSVIGGLINRKTKKIEVKKSKLFVPCAIISSIISGVGILFVFIDTFADCGMIYAAGDTADEAGILVQVISLFIFIFVSILPDPIWDLWKKHHPVKKYDMLEN